ncbi:MAG: HNH endonuclease signature motif containing protein [Corynebacterium sp.]|uniref:HNH endonuclease n=1 Tax=Corynebacterium sp. TaxID=1720 RepID=UPI0026DD39E5|nr:HNH endonuclease signature motif containing protein [Corynebacterium sp.]MDO4760641.1 HNH endonuclease signature motif containing protein [Corynebacterium sp.]
MNLVERHAQLAPLGAQLVLEIHDNKWTKHELALELDIALSRASQLFNIADTLGRAELETAATHGYSIDRLREIAGVGKRLTNPNIDPAQLRAELIDTCKNFSHNDTATYIRAHIKQLNEGYEKHRAWFVRYSGNPDADGMKYIIAKLPAAHVDRIQATLTPHARTHAANGDAVSEQEGHALALYTTITNPTPTHEHTEHWENPNNPRDLRYRPCILVPLDDAHALEAGKVVSTDGTVLSIREMVDERVRELGFAVACYRGEDGVARAQQTFEIKRLADADDRFLSIINHLVCQQADCNTNAVRCDIHHITAFARGGATTLDNLCPLCHTHNLHNDDNPTQLTHGYVFRDHTTGLVWYRDYRGNIRRNRHEAQQYNAEAYAHRVIGPPT